jgi:Methyltransferase domain
MWFWEFASLTRGFKTLKSGLILLLSAICLGYCVANMTLAQQLRLGEVGMGVEKSRPILAIKRILKKILPARLLKLRRDYLATNQYKNLSTQQIFTRIYQEGVWGKSAEAGDKFFSGTGSHNSAVVETYVKAVEGFLGSLREKPNVVDLGCGDFFVGSKVRGLCDQYVACDIVEPVISFNREKYRDLDVDFRTLDIATDELPAGDVVFVRQVLQHLPNENIAAALDKIAAKYKYLVVTEHLPALDSFVHNVDKPAGPDVRVGVKSGLVLTSEPFNLRVREDVCLCEVPESSGLGGVIRTNLYRLA